MIPSPAEERWHFTLADEPCPEIYFAFPVRRTRGAPRRSGCRSVRRSRGRRASCRKRRSSSWREVCHGRRAARIAVLVNLIGNVPCWNCKSGKDRTGQMDVECKFLSTLIARGEPIPAPGARLTKEQQSLLCSIAIEGGNFEIQKMNTAIAGFKTGSVDSVTERLGGKEYREFHRGGSDHVNV